MGAVSISLLFSPLYRVLWWELEDLTQATHTETESETVTTALRGPFRLKRRGAAMVASRVLAAKRAFIVVLKALASTSLHSMFNAHSVTIGAV